ncbi:MAG: HAMP domain-containing protein [Calditrichaeota bacterium]|nr:MAG: HAMP domain-containing protein [Calditrichota bacterium]
MLSRLQSLRFRLMALITILLLLVVGTPVYILVHIVDENFRTSYENALETTTQAIYQALFNDLMRHDTVAIRETLEEFALRPEIYLVQLYRPSGEVLFSPPPKRSRSPVVETVALRRAPPVSSGEELFVRLGDRYVHHHPIFLQQECLSCHRPQSHPIAFMDVQLLLGPSARFYGFIKKFSVFSALFTVGMLWILLNWLYERQIDVHLRKIVGAVEAVDGKRLNVHIDISGKHELALLGRKFNQMIHRLRQAREKEEQFLQEQLTRADRLVTLGEVAAEIAHEVNNPAAIIRSRSEYLREELSEYPLPPEILEDIDTLIRQTDRIARTTQSVLHYARKFPQKFSPVDLNELIRQALRVLAPRIRHYPVEVNFHPHSRPAVVRGNPTQLEQVFCNLINNSLDALDGGNGCIDIAIRQVAGTNGHPLYRLMFRDTGCGIPPEVREKIFDPFFTTKRNGRGTGLGLFIVRNIVQRHGGRVYLDNQDASAGKGTTFIIELEATDEPPSHSGD